MSRFVLPDGVSLYHWGNSLRQNVPALLVPQPPRTEDEWWKWANLLIAVNKLAYISVADRRLFPKPEDWRKWAWLFIKNYDSTAQ